MSFPIALLVIFLVILSALSVGGFIWLIWRKTSRSPPPSLSAARAIQTLSAIKKILVPTAGVPSSERVVELACRLGQEQKAVILLAYIMEVPRTMPLGTPMPLVAADAQRVLERAESIVTLHGLGAEKIIKRSRVAGEEIVHIAREREVDMIVIGDSAQEGTGHIPLGQTLEFVLRHAPCEVICDRPPYTG